MISGISLIADERLRQIQQEGWTPEHDDTHKEGNIAKAAIAYAMQHGLMLTHNGHDDGVGIVFSLYRNYFWPWSKASFKPTPDDRIRELVKAGALIAAEIDRLQRLKEKP